MQMTAGLFSRVTLEEPAEVLHGPDPEPDARLFHSSAPAAVEISRSLGEIGVLL
jgi:hypothetical protein